jgi:hypothetical protein
MLPKSMILIFLSQTRVSFDIYDTLGLIITLAYGSYGGHGLMSDKRGAG